MNRNHTIIRKHLALIVAAVLLLTSMVTAPASASALKSGQTTGHIFKNKEFCEAYPGAVEAVAGALWNLQTRVDVKGYNIPVEEADTLAKTVLFTHPELFYVSGLYSYNYLSAGGQKYINQMIFHWGKLIYNDETGDYTGREETYTDEQVLQMRQSFTQKAQWYLDKVDDSMTDFEKALVLHDAIAMNSEYLISEEIYSLMVDGRGKCYGYSEVYSYLLAQLGINTEIVESDAMYHQWNKVEIDGVYYHVDLTWDDPYPPDLAGYAYHDFFLLSDAAIESSSQRHYDYKSDFPSTDTRFDNLSYHSVNTQFCYDSGRLYAVDNTGKQLAVYYPSTDTWEQVLDFSGEYWSAGDGYVWGVMFMSLDAQDGYLYMNHENGVYVYDTQTGEKSDFASNTTSHAFYGLRIIDGKVYAVLADKPFVKGTLHYVGDCLTRTEPTTAAPDTEPVTDAPQPLMGDLDGNGVTDVLDATLLQRALAEFYELTAEQQAVADVNLDGKINVRDVTAIQRIAAEM